MSLSWEEETRGEVGLRRALRARDGALAAVVHRLPDEMDPTCHAYGDHQIALPVCLDSVSLRLVQANVSPSPRLPRYLIVNRFQQGKCIKILIVSNLKQVIQARYWMIEIELVAISSPISVPLH